MNVTQEGVAFTDYVKFKALVDGTVAVVVWQDAGAGKMLIANADDGKIRSYWCTLVESEKTTFKTDFPNYEVA